MTTPLRTDIVDGEPGHAGLHNEERVRINAQQAEVDAAEATAAAAQATAGTAYQLPADGIPESTLSADLQAKLAATVMFSTTTTRPTGAGLCIFTGSIDPGTNALAGVDLWVGEVAV